MELYARLTKLCPRRLAYAELYITIGTFFHRFGNLKVHETTDEDMKFDDFFSAYHVAGRKWLKAIAVKP
jgi:hypothetical protein